MATDNLTLYTEQGQRYTYRWHNNQLIEGLFTPGRGQRQKQILAAVEVLRQALDLRTDNDPIKELAQQNGLDSTQLINFALAFVAGMAHAQGVKPWVSRPQGDPESTAGE